jgi:hypothetical protein
MRHTWNSELDGHPLEVEARYDPDEHELKVLIDGFPVHREALPDPLWPHAKVVLDVSGHRLAVFVQIVGPHLRFEAAIDDVCLDTGRPEDQLGQQGGNGRYVPGRIQFAAERYYDRFPFWPRVCAMACLAGATMGGWALFSAMGNGSLTSGGQALLLFASTSVVSGLGWWWQDYRRTGDLFSYGDAVPAVVVGTSPLRIAVAVDLAMPNRGFFPVIRVVEQPDFELGGQPARLGDRLVALVRYLDAQNGRHWSDLQVVAATHGTEDGAALERTMDRFAPREWTRLETWLTKVEDPARPGLYRLSLPGSGFTTS